MRTSSPLRDYTLSNAPSLGRLWLEKALSNEDTNRLAIDFTLAARKLGKERPGSSDAGHDQGRAWLFDGAPIDELARVAILERAVAVSLDPIALVEEWYRLGDNDEKRAVTRALSLLRDPAGFVDVAVMACRSNVHGVFQGICCENPYPAAHFTDPTFNQMVLKAFFSGVAVDRVSGLELRRNAELARMATAYADELRAAGRRVPPDLDRVLYRPFGQGETT